MKQACEWDVIQQQLQYLGHYTIKFAYYFPYIIIIMSLLFFLKASYTRKIEKINCEIQPIFIELLFLLQDHSSKTTSYPYFGLYIAPTKWHHNGKVLPPNDVPRTSIVSDRTGISLATLGALRQLKSYDKSNSDF